MALKHWRPLIVANNETHLCCCGNCATDQCDTGSHLAKAGSRSWRWVPGAASPDVGGGGCFAPSPATRRLLAAPQRHACSPRASAGQHCAPHTPCGSFAAAASQPHVLLEQKDVQTRSHGDRAARKSNGAASRGIIMFLFASNWVFWHFWAMVGLMVERLFWDVGATEKDEGKTMDTFINIKRRRM